MKTKLITFNKAQCFMHDKNYVILNIVKRFFFYFFYFFYFMIYQIYFIHFTTKIIREKERIQKLNLPAMGGCQRERGF